MDLKRDISNAYLLQREFKFLNTDRLEGKTQNCMKVKLITEACGSSWLGSVKVSQRRRWREAKVNKE